MRKASAVALLAALGTAVCSTLILPTAAADTLIVDGLAEAQATAGERPARGMSMDKVAAKWGAPVTKVAAVGKPPISRWDYSSFTVYFENDHVIHSVLKHGS